MNFASQTRRCACGCGELEKMTSKLLSQSVEDGQRANAARKVIEKCLKSLNMWEHASTYNGVSSPEWFTRRVAEKNEALAAIKEWKAGEIKPPAA